MKTLDIPKSGKCGNIVAYQTKFGSCQRTLVIPANPTSPARQHMRGAFGSLARAWSTPLTQSQRDAWNVAAQKVPSAERLGQSGPLSGQQHFQGINSARARIGREMLLNPPEPVVFGPNPVGPLTITNGEDGVRLWLNVSGPLAEDIMVFGQAPCSAGRSKRRNVSYMGLLSVPQAGICEITELYIARYGEPRAGQKVFIVTVQQKDGWEGCELETSEIVPEKPAEQQASGTEVLTLQSHMHKGCTRDAQGSGSQVVPMQQASGEEEAGGNPKTEDRNPKEIRNPRSEGGLEGWSATTAPDMISGTTVDASSVSLRRVGPNCLSSRDARITAEGPDTGCGRTGGL